MGFPLGHDGVHGCLAHALDGRHSKTNVARMVDREVVVRLVDIGCQHVKPHALALVHEGGHLGDIGEVATQVGRHEFRRIVCLEEPGLVGDVSVADGM